MLCVSADTRDECQSGAKGGEGSSGLVKDGWVGGQSPTSIRVKILTVSIRAMCP